MISEFVEPGKLNMVVDGQFGSTGKGLISSYIAEYNHIDICISSTSPNSGHTFYVGDEKHIVKQFPIAGILSKRSQIYFSSQSVIDVDVFTREKNKYCISDDRIIIHPNAGIVTSETKTSERNTDLVQISSTLSGTGLARSNKIMRLVESVASSNPILNQYCKLLDLWWLLEQGCSAFIETGQGMDLGLDFGSAYPYCTSRDFLPSHILADCGLHPCYLGNIMVSLRTFPIRVGGPSGPFYPDSRELSWEDLNVEAERTTVTNKIRRVATFSHSQYQKVLDYYKPDFIFMNFMNYFNDIEGKRFLKSLKRIPDYLGYGPKIEHIRKNS